MSRKRYRLEGTALMHDWGYYPEGSEIEFDEKEANYLAKWLTLVEDQELPEEEQVLSEQEMLEFEQTETKPTKRGRPKK